MLLGHSLIHGEPRQGNGTTFTGIDPRTGARLSPPYHYASAEDLYASAEDLYASAEDLDLAADLAEEAFVPYGKLPGKKRARLLPLLFIGLAVLLAGSAHSLFPQVAPAAEQGRIPLVIGAGFSRYNLDYGGGRSMIGPSLWIDWNFLRLPSLLSGLGIEVEGHAIDYDHPGGLQIMRQDSAEGGAIYTWRHDRNLHVYAKYLIGRGSIDFPHLPGETTYTHETLTVLSPGFGIEYRADRNFWIRGDYEYQFWRDYNDSHDLTPHGYTIGVSYEFGTHWR